MNAHARDSIIALIEADPDDRALSTASDEHRGVGKSTIASVIAAVLVLILAVVLATVKALLAGH